MKKLIKMYKTKNPRKYLNIFIVLLALAAYFVVSLDFQLILHDKIKNSLLIIAAVLGLVTTLILVLINFLSKIIVNKYGEDKIKYIIVSLLILIIFTLVFMIMGAAAYIINS